MVEKSNERVWDSSNIAESYSGIILPIESQVTPGGKDSKIIATGKLGDIAKEAVTNVTAIIKKYFGCKSV